MEQRAGKQSIGEAGGGAWSGSGVPDRWGVVAVGGGARRGSDGNQALKWIFGTGLWYFWSIHKVTVSLKILFLSVAEEQMERGCAVW